MASHSNTDSGLGTWRDANFEATWLLHSGIGADYDMPDAIRFQVGVAQVLVRRSAELKARQQWDGDRIGVFLLEPNPPDYIQGCQWEPMLNDGATRVNGRLWFTSVVARTGHYVELPEFASNAELFSFVIDSIKMGELPTLLYNPKVSKLPLRWFPKGLSQPEIAESKPLAGNVKPDDVFEAINNLHRQSLVTPDGLPKVDSLWENSARYWPSKYAESRVQTQVKSALLGRFPYCIVRPEQPQPAGRTDLEIELFDSVNSGGNTRHAIIELKVLRSFWSTGTEVPNSTTRKWIKEGVLQAAAYRIEKKALWSALCCFDMRKTNTGDDDCFDPVRADANNLNVILKRWFLYAKYSDYRRSITDANLGCISENQ